MDSVFEVALGSGARGARVALLRELCGFDEMDPGRPGPVGVSELVERLIVEAPGPVLQRQAFWAMPLGERDRLVAGLYIRHFGDRIESFVRCTGCEKIFEVEFSLSALVASMTEDVVDGPSGPDAQGVYTLADGRRFRLPNTDDERAVRALPPDQAALELLQRCTAFDGPPDDSESMHAAMAAAGPVLDLDLPARCALCRREQTIRFDIVSFFITSLSRERALLAREVHRIAVAYHWSHDEIMRLSRSNRRAYVALLEGERARLKAAS